ncbi:MAG: 16S rRNA (cytosine(967)-C(5))-methyltransferase RsmB [Clostridia bacterium]|nr:16S rRNA (cytosine(967)-C(5))-methyltransferase RsmB [Clostridia bacterium]
MNLKYHNPRKIALDIIIKVIEKGAYANIEIFKSYRKHRYSELDKRFILEIAYGTIKRWNTLDWVLEKFVTKPLDKLQPEVRNILRMGAYQLLYMDRVPPSAACNESVELAKKFGSKGTIKFVNAVLRNISRKYRSIKDLDFPSLSQDPVRHVSLKYSHPEWLVRRWIERYVINGTIEICSYNNKAPEHSIRVNTYLTTVEDFKNLLEREGINFKAGKYCREVLIIEKGFGKLENKEELKKFYIPQSEASALIGCMAEPASGSRVLDACAAPGIKATHLAQLMGNKGEIVALDIHKHRVDLIKGNCWRLDITCIEPRLMDARTAKDHFKEGFDLVLVDAPCSGTGVLNRRADARWRKSPDEIEKMVNLQREILKGVIPLLKSGSPLVYSTCSLEPEENQMQVDWILDNFPELRQQVLKGFVPDENLLWGDKADMFQSLPHIHRLDGFFSVRFVKHP